MLIILDQLFLVWVTSTDNNIDSLFMNDLFKLSKEQIMVI